jgi:spermidine synthase
VKMGLYEAKNMNQPRTDRSRYLYVSVFINGMVTLAIELSASRLLGSIFGTSNLVWANVIGLMLLYLTLGYFIGGRWADRSPYYATFYKILIWGAFLSALIPLVARPVLRAAANAVMDAEAALALGSFISILVLFSIPVTLLGCVSPFAIRLAIHNTQDAGRVSGQIYAVSTLGSLVGTFLPVLLFIPTIGTYRTFLTFSGILYCTAMAGLMLEVGFRAAVRLLWMPLVIIGLSIWVLSGSLRPPAANMSLLFEGESSYNLVQVQEDENGYRELLLNEGLGVHSLWHKDEYSYGGTWDIFLATSYFNYPPVVLSDVKSLLVIGLAAGTIPRQFTHVYGQIPIDGIEIDPLIVEAAAKYFEMNETYMPNLAVYVADGRYMLNRLKRQYSVIAIDAYRPPYIPWHLTTVEFFQEVRGHMLPDGVVAINVGRTNQDRRLVEALTKTLLEVFPTVHTIDVPRSFNTILVGTYQPTEMNNLVRNLALLNPDTPALLRDVLQLSVESLVLTVPGRTIFTDDRAPVEMLVDALTLNFLLTGDMDDIR